MKKQTLCNKILYSIVALVLFLVGVSVCVNLRNNKELQSVQIVAFGDSLFGLVRDESGVVEQLGKQLNCSIFNAAFGGTCAARLDTENQLDYGKDALSMVGLARAVEMDDFGPQQTLFLKEPLTEHFGEVIDQLEKVDFRTVEIVLIEQGLNDFYAEIPLDNPKDPMDEYTYLGAIRRSVEALRRVNPKIRIVLVTPTYSWLLEKHVTCEEFQTADGGQQDYIEAELAMAAELGVECIDLYHDFYPHEEWEDYKVYTNDGLHPNDMARKMMAEKIAKYLEGGVE